MSELAVSPQRSPASFYDDPFAAMANAVSAPSPSTTDVLPSRLDGQLGGFVQSVFPLASLSSQRYELGQGLAQATAAPVETGLAALNAGPEAARQWVRFQLGVVQGHGLPFEVKLFEDGGFARGLLGRYDQLIDQTMQQMSPQARAQYEGIVNDEMHRAMQAAMLHDEALGEYTPLSVREFKAGGGGSARKHQLEDATRAEAQGLRQHDEQQAQRLAQADQAARLQWQGLGGTIDPMQLADARIARSDAQALDLLSRPAIDFRVDVASLSAYQGAKFDAAVDYAQQFAPEARGGIVAIAMGKDYARVWLASQLGFEEGKPYEGLHDGQPAPHARALAQRWEHLSGHTLMQMPEFLREKYAPLANEVAQRGTLVALHLDQRAGQYQDIVLRDFTAQGPGEEFKYFLNEDGSLGREQLHKDDGGNCIEQVLLPIAQVVCFVVPGLQGVGVALTVATAVKAGVEGNWLGAVAGLAGGAAGLGQLGVLGAQAASVANTVGTVARVASGAYALEQGIEHGDVLGALSGGLSVAGVVGGRSVQPYTNFASQGINLARGVESGNPLAIANGVVGVVDAGADVSGLRDSDRETYDAIKSGVGLARAGMQIYQGVETDDPMAIANGLTGAGVVGAHAFGFDRSAPRMFEGLQVANGAANLASAAQRGDVLGMQSAAANTAAHWNGFNAADTWLDLQGRVRDGDDVTVGEVAQARHDVDVYLQRARQLQALAGRTVDARQLVAGAALLLARR